MRKFQESRDRGFQVGDAAQPQQVSAAIVVVLAELGKT
jgi:hypothetical protein